MKRHDLLTAAVFPLTLLVLAGCARHKKAVRVPPPPEAGAYVGALEEGTASWYGHPYHGRPTSSGEIYNMNEMTAAHRTLPLGARIRVENLLNGRNVEVRINDRGPFADGRILDLSRAAAQKLQMIGPGTAPIRLQVVALPLATAPGFFAVQVGAFQDRGNAERLRATLAREHGTASIQNYESPKGLLFRVLVGRESGLPAAQSLGQRLRRKGFDPFVVRVDQQLQGRL